MTRVPRVPWVPYGARLSKTRRSGAGSTYCRPDLPPNRAVSATIGTPEKIVIAHETKRSILVRRDYGVVHHRISKLSSRAPPCQVEIAVRCRPRSRSEPFPGTFRHRLLHMHCCNGQRQRCSMTSMSQWLAMQVGETKTKRFQEPQWLAMQVGGTRTKRFQSKAGLMRRCR